MTVVHTVAVNIAIDIFIPNIVLCLSNAFVLSPDDSHLHTLIERCQPLEETGRVWVVGG